MTTFKEGDLVLLPHGKVCAVHSVSGDGQPVLFQKGRFVFSVWTAQPPAKIEPLALIEEREFTREIQIANRSALQRKNGWFVHPIKIPCHPRHNV